MPACRSCGAPIFWAVNDKGKREPIDADPREDGNIAIVGKEEGGGDPVVRHLKKGEGDTLPGLALPRRFVSHFATCPNASQHRRAK